MPLFIVLCNVFYRENMFLHIVNTRPYVKLQGEYITVCIMHLFILLCKVIYRENKVIYRENKVIYRENMFIQTVYTMTYINLRGEYRDNIIL